MYYHVGKCSYLLPQAIEWEEYIYRTYLSLDAPYLLNISSEDRLTIEEQILLPSGGVTVPLHPEKIFDNVATTVKELMFNNLYGGSLNNEEVRKGFESHIAICDSKNGLL